MTAPAPVSRLSLCSEGVPVPGERPQGTAHRWNTCFALEATPREWDRMRDPAGWSARQREVMGRLGEHVRASGLGYGLLMFTSTRLERGEGGLRRVRVYTRPHGAFASYDRADYQLHGEELFALMEAALLDTPHPELEERRAQTPSGSDWHVCTHGRVDAACGKFGVPLEAALSSTPEGKRVWRTSHFGGHRFAPTVQELPAGRTWAHMTPELTGRLMRREGDHRVLAPHYRGWSALEPLAQVAEAEAFARSGWWWLDTPKAAQTQQREEDRATVQLDFVGPDGTPGTLTAEVEITHHLQTRGSSHKPGTSAAPQYSVRFLENG